MTLPLDLREATAESRPMLERLWQLYRHDLSELRRTRLSADGTFPTRRLDPFLLGDMDRRAYLFFLDDSPVGLALLGGVVTKPRILHEFFVVRAVRRRGVGGAAIRQLFALHPGAWEIAFQESNTTAARFWRGVAAAAANAAWREERRPVPGKPQVPPDVWLLFETSVEGCP